MPLTYEPTWWSIVFPLDMYAVAGMYLGRADDLLIVEWIGRAWLRGALTAWTLVLLAMLHARFTTGTRGGKDRTGTVWSDKDVAYQGMGYYGVDPKRKRTPSPAPGPGPSPDSSTASRPSAKSGAEPKPSATGMANPPEPGQPWWSSEWGRAVVAVGSPLLLFAAPSGGGVAVGTSVTVGGVTLYELAA